MDTDYTKPNCGRCLKRPHDEGGKGTCPHLRVVVQGVSTYERLKAEGDHNCGAYQLGSRRTTPDPSPLPEEGLF